MKHAKNGISYTLYIVELLSDKVFLTRKFKMRIIFTAKIS